MVLFIIYVECCLWFCVRVRARVRVRVRVRVIYVGACVGMGTALSAVDTEKDSGLEVKPLYHKTASSRCFPSKIVEQPLAHYTNNNNSNNNNLLTHNADR